MLKPPLRFAIPWIGAFAAPLLVAGSGWAQTAPKAGGVPALYPSREEAEKAAKLHFHCVGAHKMGSQWMPCADHGSPHGPEHSGAHP
ncbi:MAG: DUF3721 domain-containing protein [Cyanobacteriota bacterium]|jgi:hypothetical protein